MVLAAEKDKSMDEEDAAVAVNDAACAANSVAKVVWLPESGDVVFILIEAPEQFLE